MLVPFCLIFLLFLIPTGAPHSLLIGLPFGFQKLNFFHDLLGLIQIFMDLSIAFDPYA